MNKIHVVPRFVKGYSILNLHQFYFDIRRFHSKIGRDLNEACEDNHDVVFMPLRFRRWQLGESFSNARVDAVQYLRDEKGVRDPKSVAQSDILSGRVKSHLIPFKSVFYNGYTALKRAAEGQIFDQPINGERVNDANQKFLLKFATDAFITGFLCDKDYHEKCLQKVLESDEETSVIMANHLFSRLSAGIGKTYFVTTDTKDKPRECPCFLRCGEQIVYDNTGIGSEHLWYGRPDIMVLPMGGVGCSIVMPQKPEPDHSEISEDNENIAFDEQDLESPLREKYNIMQIISVAVTFSLYQKIFQRTRKSSPFLEASLIPVIAACSESYDIYLYDSYNDILLRNCGKPIPLWEEASRFKLYRRLNLSSVSKLWMTINHMSVRPSLTVEQIQMLKDSCGFLSCLSDDQMKIIEATLKMKKKFNPIQDKEFDIEFLKLSVYPNMDRNSK